MLEVIETFTVGCRAPDVYRFLRDLENAPRFMRHLSSVTATSAFRSHWVTKESAAGVVEWDAEIIEDDLNRSLRWQSLPGTKVPNGGAVRLSPRAGQTLLCVELHYGPLVGSATETLSALFGRQPSQQTLESLRRLKNLLDGFAPSAPRWSRACRPVIERGGD